MQKLKKKKNNFPSYMWSYIKFVYLRYALYCKLLRYARGLD